MILFGFFCWHINLCELFNAKAIPVKGQKWYNLTHSWGDKRVQIFPEGISLKMYRPTGARTS